MQILGKKVMVLTVLLALATTYVVYAYLKQLDRPRERVKTAPVVVAVKSVDRRMMITAQDVKLMELPAASITSGALTRLEETVGKRAKENIYAGEQILASRVAGEKEGILSYNIPEGKRAVTVNVNEAGEVGDFIRPGDYVDILATFDKYETEDAATKTKYPRSTKVILQNIQVLGMGQLLDVPDKPRTELPRTVTLAVTLEEAEKLVFSEETAVIKMVLRRVGDNGVIRTQGVIREEIMDKGKMVVPK